MLFTIKPNAMTRYLHDWAFFELEVAGTAVSEEGVQRLLDVPHHEKLLVIR
ncbi:MAG: hypothetical protein RJS97_04760 [Parvibaculaceae bacterium]